METNGLRVPKVLARKLRQNRMGPWDAIALGLAEVVDGTLVPVIGGAAAPFDIWDQAVLTDVIVKPLSRRFEDQPPLGADIAPMRSHMGRTAKVRAATVKPFGLGQFKAPDATPPLFKADQSWSEVVIELALLEEMERISGEDWMKLQSVDEVVQRSAGVDLVTRGQILQLRNERLTEWMRWQAFSGTLTITYPTGSKIVIDYGLPSGHKPVVSSLWSDTVNSDPVADVQAWSKQLANDAGYWGTKLHMASTTWDYLIRNQKIKSMLVGAAPRSIYRPTRADILELFTTYAAAVDIVIYDNGYRDISAGAGTGYDFAQGLTSLTRYLPAGNVLMTTEYNLDGQNIADTLDGQVLVSTGYNTVDIRQGAQSEVILDQMSKNHYQRQASARIPRLLLPECFLWATVA